jgi:hypothetical protein
MSTDNKSLYQEVREAVNKHSAEDGSGTPDFIIAQYLLACLNAFDTATNQRKAWYKSMENIPPQK